MSKAIDGILQADEDRRALVVAMLERQMILRTVAVSHFLLISRDLAERQGPLSLRIHPTVRHFCFRIQQFPRAVFIIEDLNADEFDRVKAEFPEISIEGGISERQLFHGIFRRMLVDLARPRVLATTALLLAVALPSLVAVELSFVGYRTPLPSDFGDLRNSLGSILATSITVGAAYFAIFALYSGLSQATIASRAANPSSYALHSYQAERVMLGWVLLSISLAVVGQFLLPSFALSPAVRYLTEASVLLSVLSLVPPLVDVIPYFVARNYDLLIMQSVAGEIEAGESNDGKGGEGGEDKPQPKGQDPSAHE